MKRPRILCVFMTRFEECGLMLDGISKYSRSHRPWDIFLDDQALAEDESVIFKRLEGVSPGAYRNRVRSDG